MRGKDKASSSSTVLASTIAASTWLWIPVASLSLTRELAAYHYGVLAHECPWCLFTWRHHLVGFALYGSLLVAALESLAALVASSIERTKPTLQTATRARILKASWRLSISVLLFLALSLFPALVWRLRHGLWIEG